MPPHAAHESIVACRANAAQASERHLGLFESIPGADGESLCYKRGDRIEPSGEGGRLRLRIVRSGMVAANAVMRDGRRQIMCFLTPGDVICPFEIKEAECWAAALTDTEIREIVLPPTGTAGAFDPVLMDLLFRLSHRLLERALRHVVWLGRFDGAERFCAFLLDLARRTATRRGDAWHLSLPMSREDIGDHLGLSPETVSRIITRIKKDGLVRFGSPTRCEIPDIARLEARIPMNGLNASAMSAPTARELRSRS